MADNAIAKAREQEIFVVKETTIGTLVDPTTASLVIGAGFIASDQQPSFSDSPEINNSLDVLSRFADRTPSGSFTLPCMVRPSGSAGTAPQEDVLLECLLGVKTVTGGTSVAYTPALTKDSCSIWYRKGHSVFFLRGATVNAAKIGISPSGGAMWEFSGGFMQKGLAGTDLIDGLASSAATSIPVDDARKFSVGALVEFVEGSTTYNNSDAGYEVTAVNVGTNTLTITPGLEAELDGDSTIKGWLPTGVDVGDTVPNRQGSAEIDTVAVNVMELSLNIECPVKYFDEEITTTDYPAAFGELQRNVAGNMKVLFRENDLKYYYDAIESTDKALELIIGTSAGSILTIAMDKVNFDSPSEEVVDPSVAISMALKALGTDGEDSISASYT